MPNLPQLSLKIQYPEMKMSRGKLVSKFFSFIIPIASIFILGLSGCSGKHKITNPEIYNAMYPDTLYRNAGPFYVEVSVRDPQGLDDIESVEYKIDFPAVGTIGNWTSLTDTGSGGDSTAGDGRYAWLVSGFTDQDSAGQYKMSFRATDRGNHQSNVLEDWFNVSANHIPVLSDLNAPDTMYSDFPESSLIAIYAMDPDPDDQISEVWFEIFRPDGSTNEQKYIMLDDGFSGGDSIAGDGRYSLRISSAEMDQQLGNFQLLFYAKNNHEVVSEPLKAFIHIMPSNNEPPVLLSVAAPDTLSSSSPDTSYLILEVTDPQGLNDIDSVWFQSFRPNGSSNGNRYYLHDDGVDGDQTAGDGAFTIGITSYGASPLGLWRFEFWARDIHGAVSDSLDKYIRIVE